MANLDITGKFTNSGGGAVVPVGTVLDFAGTTPPQHYLLCNGQAVSRTDYAELFAIIGTTWGAGNGSTTFNVPNLVGRATIGVGTYTEGSSSKTYSLGATDGSKDAVVVEHTHREQLFGYNGNYGETQSNLPPRTMYIKIEEGGNILWDGGAGYHIAVFDGPLTHTEGVSRVDKNMMPYGVINKIIRAK